MKNGDYNLAIAPPDFPGKRYRGKYCQEHTLVYWQTTGEIPGPDELIHHKDENKKNNIFENLVKIPKVKHNAEHSHGQTMIEYTCKWCGKTFSHHKNGNFHTFCSRHCMGEAWVHRKTPNSTHLTEADVVRARERYAAGEADQAALAAELGVAETTITMMTSGRTWPNAGGPIVNGRKIRVLRNQSFNLSAVRLTGQALDS